jgi:hypothetical protein
MTDPLILAAILDPAFTQALYNRFILRGGLPLSSPHAQGGGRDPGVRPQPVSRQSHNARYTQVQP